jgi:hypothetical protein
MISVCSSSQIGTAYSVPGPWGGIFSNASPAAACADMASATGMMVIGVDDKFCQGGYYKNTPSFAQPVLSICITPADFASAGGTTTATGTAAAIPSSISLAPFDMDIPTAIELSGALLSMMAVSWVIRQIVLFLRPSTTESET